MEISSSSKKTRNKLLNLKTILNSQEYKKLESFQNKIFDSKFSCETVEELKKKMLNYSFLSRSLFKMKTPTISIKITKNGGSSAYFKCYKENKQLARKKKKKRKVNVVKGESCKAYIRFDKKTKDLPYSYHSSNLTHNHEYFSKNTILKKLGNKIGSLMKLEIEKILIKIFEKKSSLFKANQHRLLFQEINKLEPIIQIPKKKISNLKQKFKKNMAIQSTEEDSKMFPNLYFSN